MVLNNFNCYYNKYIINSVTILNLKKQIKPILLMLCIILNYLIKNTFGPSPIVFIIKCLVSCKPSLPYYMRLSYLKKKKNII